MKIYAKMIDGQFGKRWFIKHRWNIGSWQGTPGIGCVRSEMRQLNLNTGEMTMIGPCKNLPR